MDALTSLTRNTFFGILSSILSRVGNTILFILVINTLGLTGGGTYNLGLAYFFIASRFAFWGLDHLLTREVAKDRSKAGLYLTNFLFARGVLALLIVILFIILVKIVNYDPSTELVIILMLLSVFPENINNLCWSSYAAFEEYHLANIGMIANVAIKLGLGFLLLFLGADLAEVALALLLGHSMAMFINLVLVRKRYLPNGWRRPEPTFIKEQLIIGLPFIFVSVFFILDNRLDNILLSFFSTEAEIGIYGSAVAIIVALSLIPEGYRIAILPVMARYREEGDQPLQVLYSRSYKFLLTMALPLTIATIVMADEIVALLYKDALPETAMALRILAIAVTFIYINILNNRLLIVHNRQNLIARFLLVAFLVNVLANLILMPTFGAIGAAISRISSMFALFILTSWAANQFISDVGRSKYFWRLLLSTAIMGVAVWLLSPWGIWVQVFAGMLIYVVLLLLTGGLSREEINIFRQWLQRPESGT